MALDFRALWAQALPYHEYVAAGTEHRGLWEGLYRLARLPEDVAGLSYADRPRKLLALAEDWCGDASNTLPIVARLAETVPGLELRVLRRDEHPAVMNEYLTGSARAIPIIIGLDADFKEIGHWGPRPRALQEWVLSNRMGVPKAELYPQVRRWYAKDRGATTVREVLESAVTGSESSGPTPARARVPA
jgi:Thioredoxin